MYSFDANGYQVLYLALSQVQVGDMTQEDDMELFYGQLLNK